MTVNGTVRISVTAQNNAKAALEAAKRDMEALAVAAKKAEDDAAKTDKQRAALKEKRAKAAAAEALRDAQHNADAIAKINEKADEEDRKRAEERAKADAEMYADFRRHADRFAADMRQSGMKAGTALTAGLAGAITPLAQIGAKMAIVGEAAIFALPPLIAAGQAIVGFAKSAAGAAPALLAMGAAALFAKATITAIAPAIMRHMKPIADAFDVASQKASFWATRGIRPLAAEWAKVGMPIISRDMSSIGATTNSVVKGFLEWGKSAVGLKSLREFTHATANGMARLGPAVQGVVVSFGAMLGRISKVSIAAGSGGLAGALDWLNGKLDKITAESVTAGLDQLKGAFNDVRTAVTRVKNAVSEGIEFWFRYQEQIGRVRDALSVLAIAFGGPIGIIIGGGSLIARHWGKLKPIIDDVKEAFNNLASSEGGKEAMERLGGAVSWLKGQWADFVSWLTGTLWPLIKDELPKIWDAAQGALKSVLRAWDDNKQAIGEFWEVAKAVGGWLAEHLVPIFGSYLVNSIKLVGIMISSSIKAFGALSRAVVIFVQGALGVFGMFINGAAKAFGWIPGIGPKLKKAASDFNAFAARVNTALAGIRDKNIHVGISVAGYERLAAARKLLNDVQYASAGRYVDQSAHGGIVGAATGGVHGGLRWVGEQGPELVNLAPGTQVHSAGDSARMARNQGGGGEVRVLIDISGGDSMFEEWLRNRVRILGGGNVQVAFGQKRRA